MIGFKMTKEQEATRRSVREFCRKEIVPVAADIDQIADPDEIIPKVLEIMKKAKDLELSCMVIPEQYGGLGLDNVTIGILWEELAAADPGFAGNLTPGRVDGIDFARETAADRIGQNRVAPLADLSRSPHNGNTFGVKQGSDRIRCNRRQHLFWSWSVSFDNQRIQRHGTSVRLNQQRIYIYFSNFRMSLANAGQA